MTEEELQQKRKDFRDKEVEDKISQYSSSGGDAYHQQTLKQHYTHKSVDHHLPKIAWFIIISQATSIILFSSLYVFSYIPQTKSIVQKVLP